jgi:uncharacterized membrane protein YdjX (TVP38/TMEM64 family)
VSPRLRLAAFAGVLGAVFLVVLLLVARSPGEVRDTVDAAGPIAPLAFVVIGAGLTCAFFPFPLIAAASGLLFGVAAGTALSIVAGVLGAVAAFLLARAGAAGAVEELASGRLAWVQEAVARRGFVAVLYARIVPGVPRDLANYAFGLTRVSLGAYSAATVLGIAPRAFAYTALGGSLGDLDSPESVVAIALLVAMGILGLVLVRRDLRGSRPRDARRRDGGEAA